MVAVAVPTGVPGVIVAVAVPAGVPGVKVAVAAGGVPGVPVGVAGLTDVRSARISPAWNIIVWMLKYAWPFSRPSSNAASAPAAVPPWLAMNAGLNVESVVVSNIIS